MRKIATILAPALLLAALFAACGSDSKTVSIPGGGKISSSDKIPSSFPSDFPIYKGASVKGSISGSSGGISGTTVTWETGDDQSKVNDFFDAEFQKDAWKASSNGTSGGSSYWTGANSKGDKEFYALASNSDGKTNIIVTVGDNQNPSSGGSSGSGTSLTTKNKTATAETEANDNGSDEGSETPSGGAKAKTSTPSPLPDEVALSKDFPKDRVPFPSGARITSNSTFGSGKQHTYIIQFLTKDDADKVAQYFSDEMPKHGWADSFTSNTNGQYFVTFTGAATADGTQDALTVSAQKSTDNDGYTEVNISVSLTLP